MSRRKQRERRLAALLDRRERTRLAGDTPRQVLDLEAAMPMRGENREPPAGGLFQTNQQTELDL